MRPCGRRWPAAESRSSAPRPGRSPPTRTSMPSWSGSSPLTRRPDRTFTFDEFGPLGIRPAAGSCWAPKGCPDCSPATLHRTRVVTYFHGCHSVSRSGVSQAECRQAGPALAHRPSVRPRRTLPSRRGFSSAPSPPRPSLALPSTGSAETVRGIRWRLPLDEQGHRPAGACVEGARCGRSPACGPTRGVEVTGAQARLPQGTALRADAHLR